MLNNFFLIQFNSIWSNLLESQFDAKLTRLLKIVVGVLIFEPN